jgi:5-methylcytosine-specific restriction endonuclease McrBC GTP-binding regulatory subunit McrB
MQENKYQEYIELLESNKNLILTGAPGTGKTYIAKAIAEEMGAKVGFVQFHPSYDYSDFVEGLRPINDGSGMIRVERKDGIFKKFCKDAIQYNQMFYKLYDGIARDIRDGKLNFDTTNYHYIVRLVDNSLRITINNVNTQTKNEQKKGLNFDKIRVVFEHFLTYPEDWPSKATKEGFNEIIANSNIEGKYVEFYIKPIIEELLKRAKEDNTIPFSNKFVFIIDEINRGEVSKIFGELFYSIDPSYRGERGKVYTQYQNLIVDDEDFFIDGFYVPKNVYIIGTMNDIDRSVETMDFAMRRRFTWKEITPTDTEYMLDTLNCATEAKATMNRLNKAIEETENLGAAFMIGPAYYLKLGENGGDFNKLWKMNIEPLLKEYLRGFRRAKDILDKFNKVYFNMNTKNATGTTTELIDED